MKQIFESERIIYSELSEDLLNDYLIMVNDYENVGRQIGLTEPTSEEDELNWIRQKLEEKAPIFSMTEKETGEYIGNIELIINEDGAAEMGIAITAGKQNLGYGTEAIPAIVQYGFTKLGLNRIFLKVYPGNDRARHVYEKCGFSEYDRTPKDIYMEILR